ncbi:MAG: fimbrial protein, partial [Muribaculaceae bacterium]
MKNLFKYIICTLAILSLTASCSRDEIMPNDTPNEKTIHFKFDFAKTVYGDNLARSNNAENASPEECYIKDMVVFIINNGGATFKDYFYTTTPTVNNDIYTVRGGKDLPRGTYRILVVANPVGGAKAFYEKYKDTAPTAIALGSITEKANIDILPASIDS